MLADQLTEAGKDDWARQEFDNLRSFEPAVRVEAWRRTSGLHKVRGRRALGAVRALWEARDELARERDVTPGRLIPDSAIVAAATAMPTNRAAMMSTPGFHGRGASRFAPVWLAAIKDAAEMDEADLPSRTPGAMARPRLGPGRRRVRSRHGGSSWPALRCPRSHRSTTCPPRTCSPPTTCGGRCGSRRRPATRWSSSSG